VTYLSLGVVSQRHYSGEGNMEERRDKGEENYLVLPR